MHINISKSETGNNKGSSSRLVAYLEKENRLHEKLNDYHPELWFNYSGRNIRPYEVRQVIDNNIAKLSKDDAKFFLINISPSEKELRYLKEKYGQEGAKNHLKEYANTLMDAYAKNFKRESINSNRDLVYYGKVERYRYYTYKDQEVRKGIAKRGEQKLGEQMHVQVIVSRKDATNTIKLSPLNNSRGTNTTHSQKVGQFDRVAFKQEAERLFDQLFNYERNIEESFAYANTLKHGSYEQKQEMKQLRSRQSTAPQKAIPSTSKGIIETLLEGQHQGYGEQTVDDGRRRRKKRRRGYGYDGGYSR
ncbi:molybdopterin-guanine dinucleotide biosynthesis protein MobB [Mucilaginibacter sp. JRF]|uniref:DUF5712 family protein n=1 Tax=Mucilaginibacter sp. JRF TaxID=2780088 RepID=UPI00187E8D56|nr:DUF5712 family protein [Mucilaginibacter sp. JRF]MBE9584225.1 molybdopterin-guanine dinucleotide biosynthesis protein MobB [Mucilaginibacter sp. JRF]